MRTPLNLQSLSDEGLVVPHPDCSWGLTPKGVAWLEQDASSPTAEDRLPDRCGRSSSGRQALTRVMRESKAQTGCGTGGGPDTTAPDPRGLATLPLL